MIEGVERISLFKHLALAGKVASVTMRKVARLYIALQTTDGVTIAMLKPGRAFRWFDSEVVRPVTETGPGILTIAGFG